MALDTEEQEQVEQIKAWLAENGWFIFITLVVVVLTFLGYQYWTRIHHRDMAQASVYYEQLLDDLVANKATEEDQASNYLIQHYPHSIYAKLAGLLFAKRDVNQLRYDDAQLKLKQVIDQADIAALKEIARLRVARIDLEIHQPQKALDILKKIDAEEYSAAVATVKGDAYVQMNQLNAARINYRQALLGLPEDALLHSIVLMKLNNLPSGVP